MMASHSEQSLHQWSKKRRVGPTMSVWRCQTCFTSFQIPESWTVFTCEKCEKTIWRDR